MSQQIDIKTQYGGEKRVSVYDWMRLIGTIFVVIGHSAYLNIQTSYGGVAYNLPENLSYVYNWNFFIWCRQMASWVYGFHMPLFFMLSGSVLAVKPLDSFDKVMKAKVKRLMIPYFVYGWLFMLPIKRLGHFYDNVSLINAMKGFLSGQDSGHLWFLPALFWCIIAFVILIKLFEKINICSLYLLLLSAGILQIFSSYISIDVLGLKTGLQYIFYFALGYAFECERKTQEKWNVKKIILAYIICLLLEVINYRYGILNNFFTIITGAFMTYILSGLFDCLFAEISKNNVWKFIIRNLFYVYLLHDPMNYVVLRLFMGRNLLTSGVGCVAYILFRTVVIFAACVFLGEAISRLKKYFAKIMADKTVAVSE